MAYNKKNKIQKTLFNIPYEIPENHKIFIKPMPRTRDKLHLYAATNALLHDTKERKESFTPHMTILCSQDENKAS